MHYVSGEGEEESVAHSLRGKINKISKKTNKKQKPHMKTQKTKHLLTV